MNSWPSIYLSSESNFKNLWLTPCARAVDGWVRPQREMGMCVRRKLPAGFTWRSIVERYRLSLSTYRHDGGAGYGTWPAMVHSVPSMPELPGPCTMYAYTITFFQRQYLVTTTLPSAVPFVGFAWSPLPVMDDAWSSVCVLPWMKWYEPYHFKSLEGSPKCMRPDDTSVPDLLVRRIK